jgi:hypothetical protein
MDIDFIHRYRLTLFLQIDHLQEILHLALDVAGHEKLIRRIDRIFFRPNPLTGLPVQHIQHFENLTLLISIIYLLIPAMPPDFPSILSGSLKFRSISTILLSL